MASPAPWTEAVDPYHAMELLVLWDALSSRCPDPKYPVDHLATVTGLSAAQLHHARRIRVACAHPANRRATPGDIDKAVTILRQAWRTLSPPP